MNIVPPSGFASNVSTTKEAPFTANAAPSLPDKFRMQHGALPLNSQLNGKHPLESRLQSWEETQQKRQLEQYRQIFGVAEPMKRMMELKIVEQTDFNPLSDYNTSIHRDILTNKDSTVDWEDVYPGTGLSSGMMVGDDIHTKIEKKLGI